ncbi:toast rack family protein [Bacillus marinisedimentorum]|uniref:toast rack family protein n=1 Tax=Bacillus marinisedimentorum TaxID=1821260 RepID=UPI0007DF571F|nr:toast rack family protein [Bacillus marinisedimentorum]
MRKWIVSSGCIAVMLLFVTGCQTAVSGETEESDILVEKDEAVELEVELKLGAGELAVSSGAREWVEGTVVYNHKDFEPETTYDSRGKKGKVVIEQKKQSLGNISVGDIKNEWNIRLNKEIPIELAVNSGASDTELDLSGLNLSGLEINAGVGDISVDLSGDWPQSFDVTFETGVGKTTVILPKSAGVKIETHKGIGETNIAGFISEGDGVYVNDAYGKTDVQIEVEANLGVGEANFELK